MSGIEASINERVNSQIYSDVIDSYVDINVITNTRNIVPGSYKESVVQCTDQTLATLNSAGGQTLFTRFKLTPQVRNATMAQLAQIYFQYYIKENSLGIMLKDYSADQSTAENLGSMDTCTVDFKANPITDHLKFKLFYDTGFSIASMVQLCLTADAKVSTENFNYQQSLLTLNSLPDYVTENSNCETTLKSLVENPGFRGVGSGLIDVPLDGSTGGSAANVYVVPINTAIGIEGVIDLDRGNPLFHNFPIITRNMGELYIRLYMENFLRELKVVYLNKSRAARIGTLSGAKIISGTTLKATANWGSIAGDTATLAADTNITGTFTLTNGAVEYLPYARLPADKSDFVYLDGKLYKVKLVNLKQNAINIATSGASFEQTNPIYALTDITWTRFEIRKVEFDVEDFDDIKASQAKAGTYKFPVHVFRSKNFDQTNAASSSANALQTTLNAPNIDRIFITQPYSRDYYTFLPTLAVTDINPQLHNNPVLPRTEDCLNARTIERIGDVFVETDKYSIPSDLYNSLNVPTYDKQLWIKGNNTYGGEGAVEKLQRGVGHVTNTPIFLPNKFAYALELNEGGCFRRGYNSVIDGNYSPTVPVNLQQSTQTSKDIYYSAGTYDTGDGDSMWSTNGKFNSMVSYGPYKYSGAVASVHCLCDYIFWINFDQFGMMTDFGISEYNDRN